MDYITHSSEHSHFVVGHLAGIAPYSYELSDLALQVTIFSTKKYQLLAEYIQIK